MNPILVNRFTRLSPTNPIEPNVRPQKGLISHQTSKSCLDRIGLKLAMLCLVALIFASTTDAQGQTDDELNLNLRYQIETKPGTDRYHQLVKNESWDPQQTALIICDVWDSHHCKNAVLRVNELAPRLNQVVQLARQSGVTIIHAPSGCMDSYKEHPARQRAQQVPKADNLPDQITQWCYQIPSEEQGVYPIDQSDGGEDDDPAEHAAWAEHLTEIGRDPNAPWLRQIDTIKIDDVADYITDQGDEVWSILQQHGIKNVMIAGVHTNMCVLGRPFGLRRMASNGMNTVLIRDMTDTMYNPKAEPYVSHFTGTDLIVSHIERHICATITSEQLIGGETFRFANDKRPHIALMIGEDEYQTEETLPKYALEQLGKQYRVSYVFGSETERNDFPGLTELEDVDLLLVSVRRRLLPPEQMQWVKEYVASGRPLIGIRTASHAFAIRSGEVPSDVRDWPEFDQVVFGGNYHNHHGNDLKSTVMIPEAAKQHPILDGIDVSEFEQGGSLYMTSPLAENTVMLMNGKVEGKPIEPVSWVFERQEGGLSFYTSMGHVNDFDNKTFIRMMNNAVEWLLEASAKANEASYAIDEISTNVFSTGEEGYHTYRIPAIVKTKHGTLLAFAEARKEGASDAGNIDLVVRRSTDNGKTWSKNIMVWDDGPNTCGNPTPVVDQSTGTIWMPMTWNKGSDHERQIMAGTSDEPRKVFVTHSNDDGMSWSTPTDISESVRKPHWRWYATGPGNAIQLTRGPHQGRLLIPANHSDHQDEDLHPYRSHVFWSDDHGKTWELGAVQEPKTNESAVVELADGRILHSMRSYHEKHNRAMATSDDGGASFGKVYLQDDLPTPVCQGNVLRFSWPAQGDTEGGVLLHSAPTGKGRERMEIKISRDEAKTWPESIVVYDGSAAYSNMVKLDESHVGILFEKDNYKTIHWQVIRVE